MSRLSVVLSLLLLGLASPARAQRADLDEVETLIAAGKYADARARLEHWWKAPRSGDDAEPALRARALLLRARLAPDFGAAEADYLAVAIGYPTSPQAPEALLALGQGLLATGDLGRAGAYLERLAADYPGGAHRATGLLWLARVRLAGGQRGPACAALADARRAATDPELAALIGDEEAACRQPPAASAAAAAGRFTIQTGAFRDARGAELSAAALRRAGFDPRIARIPGADLLRVRVGRFQRAADAEPLLRRLRAAGFTAIVVDDAGREQPPAG